MKRPHAHTARTSVLLTGLILVSAAVGWLLPGETATALPMYAQRSGRTCANCHASPTLESEEGWENPELLARKCTMSCVACHVNPTGGGLRNASGRYYGQSTLAVLPTQERSYDDHDDELLGDAAVWRYRQRRDRPARRGQGPDDDAPPEGWTALAADGDRIIPSDWEEVQQGIGQGQTGNWTAAGEPLGAPVRMAFWDGRYDDLNADPMLQVGGDVRAAYWSGTGSVFPMQVDLHGAFHPVEHLTFMATGAVQGRSSGLLEPGELFFARNAFVMLHELPGMSWAKAGVFLPSFGVYGDDHTGFNRSLFEQDLVSPDDTVAGVELGTAPNYPFATVSLFSEDETLGLGTDRETGWGAAVNGGWRDLGWSLSGHGMVKRRGGLGRGDLLAGGIGWGFNPAYYAQDVPLTLVGEVSVGRVSFGQGVGGEAGPDGRSFGAAMVEGQWWLYNGVSVRSKVDAGVLDLATPGSLQHRYGLALEVVPVVGFTVTTWGRLLVAPGGGGVQPDLFVQAHGWF